MGSVKMLPICYICLRNNPTVRTLNDQLDEFYEDLCDCSGEENVQFCAECTGALQKCYEFKKKCKLAARTLKKWRKEKAPDKMPVDELYTKMPAFKTQLGMSMRKNFKVFYQAPESNNITPIQTNNHPNILTLNISQDEEIEPLIPVQEIKNECIKNEEENNFDIITDITVEKNEAFVKCDENLSDEEYLPEDTHASDDSDKDFSDNDDMTLHTLNKLLKTDTKKRQTKPKAAKKEIKVKKERKPVERKSRKGMKLTKPRKKEKPFDREEFKRHLRNKFEENGIVKDEKGNVIDVEIVLNSLDKLANNNNLKHIRYICSGPGPFKPLAIQRLAELQAHFTEYDSVFSTEYLSDVAQAQAEFERRREGSNYVRLINYRCELCIRGFVNQKLLDYHNETQHDPSLQFECHLCHTRHKTNRALMRHIHKHNMVYRCKLCTDFVTSNRPAMIIHYHKHRGVKYKCEHCGNEFLNKANLYMHYNIKCKKINIPKYICRLCARPFAKEIGLKRHKYIKHKGAEFTESPENTKCEECDIIFLNYEVYTKHVEIAHKDGTEVKERRFICKLCNSEGNNSHWLPKHFAKEHPDANMSEVYPRKKYLCDFCGKVFCNASFYNDHMNTHAAIRPYECSDCPKRFSTKALLRVHIQSHNPPTRECSTCGKMFVTAAALHRHNRTHIGDRRYVCEICGKGFNFSDALKAHVNGVHYNIRPVRRRKQEGQM